MNNFAPVSYVVPIRGVMRGSVGRISGSLADRKQNNVTRVLVKFKADFPNDIRSCTVGNLREATRAEAMWQWPEDFP